MTWLVWRQYRALGAIAFVLLAAFAAATLAGGLQIASRWHSMLASCSGHIACLQQQEPLPPLVSQSMELGSQRCGARLGLAISGIAEAGKAEQQHPVRR